jgi:hypothetical protein
VAHTTNETLSEAGVFAKVDAVTPTLFKLTLNHESSIEGFDQTSELVTSEMDSIVNFISSAAEFGVRGRIGRPNEVHYLWAR